MAEEELELDVNEKKGGNKTMILVIVGILLLNGIGIGAWIFLSGADSKSTAAEKQEEVVLEPLKYLTLVPEFIVNFGPESKVRYLQIDLQISSRDKSVFKTVNTYRPVIRNDILVLLSNVTFDDLKDRTGKIALQKKLLDVINKVVVESLDVVDANSDQEDVKGPIENVYFIHFIMQ